MGGQKTSNKLFYKNLGILLKLLNLKKIINTAAFVVIFYFIKLYICIKLNCRYSYRDFAEGLARIDDFIQNYISNITT